LTVSPQTKILIIEDEEILAANMRDYLAKRAAEVRSVTSGEAALECIATFTPDLLVLDYGLPGMDGLQTFAALKARQSRLAGVLITGHPTDSILHAAAEVGIGQVLSKPFAFSDLAQKLFTDTGIPTCLSQDDERRLAELRRNGQRRYMNGSITLPMHTAAGCVTREQRREDRRTTRDRRMSTLRTGSGST
jgi:DNA-binding response OmpR family regulator